MSPLVDYLSMCCREFCGRCFEYDTHSSGVLYDKATTVPITNTWLVHQLPQNLLHCASNNLNPQHLFSDESFDSPLLPALQKIAANRNSIWAKHSPEASFAFNYKYYPLYKDTRPVAVETSDLRTMRCLWHGRNELYLLGIIPLQRLRTYCGPTRNIPESWGRDHLYFEQGFVPIDEWVFAVKHYKEHRSHFPITEMGPYEPILSMLFIRRFLMLIDKIYSCFLAFGGSNDNGDVLG